MLRRIVSGLDVLQKVLGRRRFEDWFREERGNEACQATFKLWKVNQIG